MVDWPYTFALDIGESTTFSLAQTEHTFTLRSVDYVWAPDYWIRHTEARQVICAAEVGVEVDGVETTLWQRPYQMPVEVSGLRVYVETTQRWATESEMAQLPDLEKVARFSVVPAGQPWGPEEIRFPIQDYRWRAASYNNTWSSLVPYNKLYYHRGDDFGAIPDRLNVLAMLAGEVTASPVPLAAASNAIAVRSVSGLTVRYAHMNIELLDPHLIEGAHVQTGQVLGKTGCTWNGYRSQWADPHLHVSFAVSDMRVSSYPYFVEAYLRDYPDDILPVAGGYYFTTVGEPVLLDATRSVARDGCAIASYTWRLHNGTRVNHPVAEVSYDVPGQYAEELTVTAENGVGDRDFAHVRVYDPDAPPPEAFGWVYSWPLRGLQPGTPVLFWNRLMNTRGPVTIDYGDGWPPIVIEEEAWHTYSVPGLYTVTLLGYGAREDVVMAKFRVIVE